MIEYPYRTGGFEYGFKLYYWNKKSDKASAPFGFLSITEDKYIEGFKKLNDVVHDVGEKTCIQLWQGGLAVALD